MTGDPGWWRSMGLLLLVGMVVAAFVSCRHEPQKFSGNETDGHGSTYIVARVGNTELTMDEVKAHIDTSQLPYEDQIRRYVAHWVNEELLYQEAQRRGIQSSEALERRLLDAQRQLVAEAFVEQQIYYNDTALVSDSILHEYYNAHAAEFFVPEDLVKINIAIFNTRERASRFAASVTRGASWDDALEALLQDSAASASFVSSVRGQYYSRQTIFPQELWKVTTVLSLNDVSFPVNTSVGYCVVQPLDRVQQGKPASFDIARDEVRQRVLIEGRRQRYDSLLGTLRNRYTVEVMLGSEKQTDSTNQSHE